MRQGAASAGEALVSTGEVERVELDVHQGALPNAATPHARMEVRSLALPTRGAALPGALHGLRAIPSSPRAACAASRRWTALERSTRA